MAGVMYYGAIQYNEGKITVGEISSFLLYMISLIFNFAIVALVFGNIFKMIGASEKIIKMMKHVPNVNAMGGVTLEESQVVGEIELENVSFSYPTKENVQILKNVTLKIG